MSVTLMCPNLKCRKILQVPDAVRGKPVRCSHCNALVVVPAAPVKPEETAKAPAEKK